MMAFAFLESLLVTGVLVMLSAILPPKWLRDGFVFKGFILIGMATIAAIILQRTLQGELPSVPILTLIWFTPGRAWQHDRCVRAFGSMPLRRQVIGR